MNELAKLNIARQALAEAKTLEDIKQIKDIAVAVRAYAQAKGLGIEMKNEAAEVEIRAIREMGRLIQEKQEAGELAKKNTFMGNRFVDCSAREQSTLVTFPEIGITRKESFTSKNLASISTIDFEAILQEFQEGKKLLSKSAIFKKIKEEERLEMSEQGKSIISDVDFRLGDFEFILSDIPDNSVDCIITDPPYPFEFIDCWTKLSRFASKKLKPNGFCIAYSGQYNLPEVIKRMDEYLDYYWTFAVYHEGQTQIVNAVNLICRWKPVLIYQKDRKKIDNTIQDYFISEQREKDGHDWQQSVSGVSYLIDRFTKPGDLIVEPFAGSGTTIIAAKNLHRNIIAAEIDEETYNIAKLNINDKT